MKLNKEEIEIADVKSLHSALLREVDNNQEVLIDMSNVKKIDMSIIQLLISVQLACKKKSKKFKLHNVNDRILHILQNAFCDFLIEG